jgi:hypothetical protein
MTRMAALPDSCTAPTAFLIVASACGVRLHWLKPKNTMNSRSSGTGTGAAGTGTGTGASGALK